MHFFLTPNNLKCIDCSCNRETELKEESKLPDVSSHETPVNGVKSTWAKCHTFMLTRQMFKKSLLVSFYSVGTSKLFKTDRYH